jgi:two-component system chemotaxis response regulator CheB
VVGVVLSGVLDDGTAGLSVIKERGGATLVQEPEEALYPMMPTSAIEGVQPDRVLGARALAAAIVELAQTPVDGEAAPRPLDEPVDTDTLVEIDRSASKDPRPGTPSGFSCPECGGGLWETTEGGVTRFRCRTGHGYAFESLLADQGDAVEAALWSALRTLEERARSPGRWRCASRAVAAAPRRRVGSGGPDRPSSRR